MINLKRFLFEDKLEATQMNAQILFCSFAVMGLLLFIILVYLIKKYIQMGKNEKEEQLRKIWILQNGSNFSQNYRWIFDRKFQIEKANQENKEM